MTEKELLALEESRFAAMVARDFTRLDSLVHDQLLYTHSSGVTDTKASWLQSLRSGRVKYRKMTPNGDVTTRTYGCIAIITGTAVYEVTSGGQDRTVPLRFTAIWAKRSSGPEFVSWQSTGIPPRQ